MLTISCGIIANAICKHFTDWKCEECNDDGGGGDSSSNNKKPKINIKITLTIKMMKKMILFFYVGLITVKRLKPSL